MSTPPFDAACRTHMAAIVQDVYRTMVRVDLAAADPAAAPADAPLTAAVYYAGAWKGALLIECSTPQAARWASLLMSLPAPISDEDVRDGLGELTNMIAGNLKPLLPPGVTLSIPSVVEGAGHKLRVLGEVRSEILGFCDDAGAFRVALVRVLEDNGAALPARPQP